MLHSHYMNQRFAETLSRDEPVDFFGHHYSISGILNHQENAPFVDTGPETSYPVSRAAARFLFAKPEKPKKPTENTIPSDIVPRQNPSI